MADVGDMGSHPGGELQVVHPLQVFGLFAIPVADLAFSFIQGETFQGQQRPDHVFSHPLGKGPARRVSFSELLGSRNGLGTRSGLTPEYVDCPAQSVPAPPQVG